VYAVVVLGALWMFLPVWWAISASFSATAATGLGGILPHRFTFDNYMRVWNAVPVGRWFLNSFIFAGAVTVFNLTFDSLAGYALAKIDFFAREKVFLVFISTMMIPFIILLIPLYLLIVELGWTNTYQGLIVPFIANPFGIFLLRQHFKSLPSSLGDAARIDGCNELQTFYRVYLPLAKPALATLGIFTFMWAWKNFEWPLIVAGDESMYTLPLAMFRVRSQYFTAWPPVMAAAVVIVAPMLVAFLSAQRYFIRGMTLSGMKG
jgi:multiple sugar transport system permease protein